MAGRARRFSTGRSARRRAPDLQRVARTGRLGPGALVRAGLPVPGLYSDLASDRVASAMASPGRGPVSTARVGAPAVVRRGLSQDAAIAVLLRDVGVPAQRARPVPDLQSGGRPVTAASETKISAGAPAPRRFLRREAPRACPAGLSLAWSLRRSCLPGPPGCAAAGQASAQSRTRRCRRAPGSVMTACRPVHCTGPAWLTTAQARTRRASRRRTYRPGRGGKLRMMGASRRHLGPIRPSRGRAANGPERPGCLQVRLACAGCLRISSYQRPCPWCRRPARPGEVDSGSRQTGRA